MTENSKANRRFNDSQKSLFAVEDRLDAIAHNNRSQTLSMLSQIIPWESFRPILRKIYTSDRSKGGRPPFDEVMMFKVLILQTYFDYADEEMEFQIYDSLSFSSFLGINTVKGVPDCKTIWLFRDKLTKAGLINDLFDKFNSYLTKHGLILKKGIAVDATFMESPKQRNGREENKSIKEGEEPTSFEKKTRQERNHKDVDARWTMKNNQSHFGYKNHTAVDLDHKFIVSFSVTAANVHDSQALFSTLPSLPAGTAIFADSAYASAKTEERLKELNLCSQIYEKGCRNRPLSKSQIQSNHRKSQKRCRIEHVFGDMAQSFGKQIRSIGISRATTAIALKNIVYNMRRLTSLVRNDVKIRKRIIAST